MVVSADRYSSTSAWPYSVPWLHTLTWAVKPCPGVALAGPTTSVTMKSGWWPTPTRVPASVLLSSRSSERLLRGSTTAPSYQALGGELYGELGGGGVAEAGTGTVSHCPGTSHTLLMLPTGIPSSGGCGE